MLTVGCIFDQLCANIVSIMAGIDNNFSVKVDRKQCIGCNLCCEVAVDVFYLKGEKSEVKKDADLKNKVNQANTQLAANACPVGAIIIN